jgi:hypothetical protein
MTTRPQFLEVAFGVLDWPINLFPADRLIHPTQYETTGGEKRALL